jgi:hypothetical protein
MQIYNTMVRGEYPAPNNVILTRAVKLTARELQATGVSVEAITIEDDCSLSVEFMVETGIAISDADSAGAAIGLAQTKLAHLGIPHTAQVLVVNPALDPSAVRVLCRFFVQPQECWPDVFYMGPAFMMRQNPLQLVVRSFHSWTGDESDYLAFVGANLILQSADEFIKNVWRKFPWQMHWFIKDAYYQVSPVSADGKSVTITYQPFPYGFGTVRAPACTFGELGELLFDNALRPVMNCC